MLEISHHRGRTAALGNPCLGSHGVKIDYRHQSGEPDRPQISANNLAHGKTLRLDLYVSILHA
jgi:hypothetical protein